MANTKQSDPSSRPPRLRRLLPTLLLAGAVPLVACDESNGPSPRLAAAPDLAQFGIDQLRTDPSHDHAYQLLDHTDDTIGRVELDTDDAQAVIGIELDGAHAWLRWSSSDLMLECEGAPDTPTDACRDIAIVAALVAEAEGTDVPGYDAAPELLQPAQFREACETVTTWGYTCAGCEAKAADASTYSHHESGSCTARWFDVTCTHKYCSGDDFEIEIGGQW
ncbi:MAG: hypothetical protein K0V04_03580 [Deltaproteobacteria bacterium]|nr:hypothetical protein [Deltaproteobacteria bacterium]